MSEDIWAERDTNPDAIEAALREMLRQRHAANEALAPDTNDGLGRWWRTEEIEAACRKHGLNVRIENQPDALSNYRMDALIVP